MTSPSLKKLVVIFLILSAVASSGVFLLLDNQTTKVTDDSFVTLGDVAGGTSASPPSIITTDTEPAAPLSASSNLLANDVFTVNSATYPTKSLAFSILQTINLSNKNTDGTFDVIVQSSTQANEILNQAIVDSINALRAEFDPNTPVGKIETTSDDSTQSKQAYLDAVVNSLSEISQNSHFDELVVQTPSREVASAAEQTLDQVVKRLTGIAVPPTFTNFHQKLLVYYDHKRKVLDIALNSSTDPLQAVTMLHNSSAIFDRDEENLKQAFAATGYQKETSENIRGGKMFDYLQGVGNLFTIPKAYAAQKYPNVASCLFAAAVALGLGSIANVVPVSDRPTEGATFADCMRSLWDWLEKLWNEELKAALIKQMQNTIVNWITNPSSIKYAVNWNQYLDDIFSDKGRKVLDTVRGVACTRFSNFAFNMSLPSITPPDLNLASLKGLLSCSYNNTAAVGQFFNDFRAGGWATYDKLLVPKNNAFGQTYLQELTAQQNAAKQEASANSELNAGKGFMPQRECNLYSNKPGEPQRCLKWGDNVKTPGDAISNALAQALASPFERVANSDELVDVVSATISAALKQFSSQAQKFLKL